MSTNDRGNSNELIYLLHRNDNRLNLLLRRDEEYATYIQSESYVPTTTNQVSTVVTEESVWNPGCEEATAAAAYATYTPRVRDTLPHLFYCDGDLCGLIMKRTQTKVFFKKWKHCIFVVKPQFLLLYASVEDWKQNRGVYWQKQLHPGIVLNWIHSYSRWSHLSLQNTTMIQLSTLFS